MKLKNRTFILILAIAGELSANAELLVYESFHYRMGVTVQSGETLGEAGLGFANAWLFTGYSGEITTPLSFDGVTSSGNALKITRNDGGSLFRGLDQQLSAGTYYVGMVFLRNDTDNGGRENWSLLLRSESSHTAGPSSTSLLSVGTTSDEQASLKIGTDAAQTGSEAYVIGSPVFMLARFTIHSDGEETASMKWYNPGDALPSNEDMIVWDVTTSGEFSGGGGWSLILPSYIGTMTIDEFRMGTELMDVIAGLQNGVSGEGDEDYQKVLNRSLLTTSRYRIYTGDTVNKYITVDMDSGYIEGAPVELQSASSSLADQQQWILEPVTNDIYAVRAADSVYYLQAGSGTGALGAGDVIQIHTWNGSAGQLWDVRLQGDQTVILCPYGQDLCLTRSGETDGATMELADNTGSEEQLWEPLLRENVQSPSITRGTDGALLAMFKYLSVDGNNGVLYASNNDGKSWALRKKFDEGVYGQTLFVLNNALYMIYSEPGESTRLKLAKSTDHGYSWSYSFITDLGVDVTSGGASEVIRDGVLYYAFIDRGGPSGSWSQNFRLRVASCPVNSNLMTSGNWTISDPLGFPSSPAVSGTRGGWLEPNCVPGPDGKVWVIARVDKTDTGDVAAVLKVSADRTDLEFVNQYPAPGAETGFIEALWAGCSKFHILYDDASQRYLILSNPYMGSPSANSRHPYVRNILALYESADLKNYRLVKTLINDDVYEDWEQSSWYAGFQYPAFIIDGETLRYVSRTAYRTYRNYHDANYGSYHELRNFRHYLSPDGEIARYHFDDPADCGYNSAKMRGSSADVFGATYASGKYGGCLLFDGSDDYLGLMQRMSPRLHHAGQISLSVWLKTAGTSSPGAVFTSPIDGMRAGLALQCLYGKMYLSGRSCSSDEYQNRVFDLPSSGEWHHIVALWDFENEQMRLWLDTVEQVGEGFVSFARDAYTRGAPSVQDTIGKHFQDKNYFDGSMDEFRLFSRALSQDEIEAFYNSFDGPSGFLFQLRASNP